MPNRVSGAGFIALTLLTVACSSSSQGGTAAPSPRQLDVKVRDFQIKAPRSIAAGDVVLRVRNAGPETHELILVRSNGRPLPLRADDLTVDEDAIKSRTVGVLDDDHPGGVRHWKVHLAPGRYQLVCNMSGHYLGGMRAEVVVR
jgi:uncharacterized cupredoxin-like copper-binding protein